jgi:hypothetical protein
MCHTMKCMLCCWDMQNSTGCWQAGASFITLPSRPPLAGPRGVAVVRAGGMAADQHPSPASTRYEHMLLRTPLVRHVA